MWDCPRRHAERSKRRLVAIGALCVVVLPCGLACSSSDLDSAMKNLFKPQLSPQQYMLVAVSEDDPDQRRDALAEVAQSDLYAADWAIKGYTTIALLERDSQSRCVALRALRRTKRPAAVDVALKLLNYREHPAREVRPPGDLERWDATELLADAAVDGWATDEQRDAVRAELLERLSSDSDRHVRHAGARGLAAFAELAVVEALIDGVEDEDFAVVHRCEMSLVQLTGVTHDCNVLTWEDWLANNREAVFADRGHIPEKRRPPYTTGWGGFVYGTKQWIDFLWPGAKQ